MCALWASTLWDPQNSTLVPRPGFSWFLSLGETVDVWRDIADRYPIWSKVPTKDAGVLQCAALWAAVGSFGGRGTFRAVRRDAAKAFETRNLGAEMGRN